MVIKTLVDKSAFNPIEDDDGDLQNFCVVMEHIFSHRLQGELLGRGGCRLSLRRWG